MDRTENEKVKKPRRLKHVFVDEQGTRLNMKVVDKFFRDVLVYNEGATQYEKELVTLYDLRQPLSAQLKPSAESPICRKCGLFEKAHHPFMEPVGADQPLVTVIVDSVSSSEDTAGSLLGGSSVTSFLKRTIEELFQEHGVPCDQIRFVPLTRCASRAAGTNYKSKGNWCRLHLLQDLEAHKPKLIMPVGTSVLGLLSYKSSAQDWSGRLLTFRGWPDDWLTNKAFRLPRQSPYAFPETETASETCVGHPLFGAPPSFDTRIPMVPIQAPGLVYKTRSPIAIARWRKHVVNGLRAAKEGVNAPSYTRPWYEVTESADRIEAVMRQLLQSPGILLCFDTETTGLRPLADDAAIVFMMFRWTDPLTEEPRSIGFPWDCEAGKKLRPHFDRLAPLILKVLKQSKLLGHNLTFDILYTHFNVHDPALRKLSGHKFIRAFDDQLVALADAAKLDTWHMRHCLRQARGSLGLEILTYDHCPDLAGYEEDMTLLIQLRDDLLHPAKGGHYANCPRELWDSHLIPYVMGDVEACHGAYKKIEEKLSNAKRYRIPLAMPSALGRFRTFEPPSRSWAYHSIMSPAAQVLIKMMGRGMYVDQGVLATLRDKLQAEVKTNREALRTIDPEIIAWSNMMKHTDPKWTFDLEEKTTLRTVLFDILKLPVQRLTKNGRKVYGEDPAAWPNVMRQAMHVANPTASAAELDALQRKELLKNAAIDKFTLNKLAVDHPKVRPLQEYRKVFKMYSAYIRPMFDDCFDPEIDSKHRDDPKHLCKDGYVHAQFKITGTRGGRISCVQPNLQQLSGRGDVKSMYISRFGKRGILYGSDLSQIELRLMAAACGDPSMIDAYRKDIDLHSLTASKVYKIPYEHFTKDYMAWLQKKGKEKEAKALDVKRKTAKTVNFLTGYGGGAFGLQTSLANNGVYLSIEECEYIIDSFFAGYPSLASFLSFYKRFILDNSVAVSLFGRVRVFEEVGGGDKELVSKALRAGCNHLIQSTAADMMLTALVVIEGLMRQANLESMLVLTVHDSLLIDAVREELPAIHEIVDGVLNNYQDVLPAYFGPSYDTSWMIVPFAGDAEIGNDYLNMVKVGHQDVEWDKMLALADEEQ